MENIVQDAQHIFEAQKYGDYFITTDDRILKRAGKLYDLLKLRIVKPSQFLAMIK